MSFFKFFGIIDQKNAFFSFIFEVILFNLLFNFLYFSLLFIYLFIHYMTKKKFMSLQIKQPK